MKKTIKFFPMLAALALSTTQAVSQMGTMDDVIAFERRYEQRVLEHCSSLNINFHQVRSEFADIVIRNNNSYNEFSKEKESACDTAGRVLKRHFMYHLMDITDLDLLTTFVNKANTYLEDAAGVNMERASDQLKVEYMLTLSYQQAMTEYLNSKPLQEIYKRLAK